MKLFSVLALAGVAQASNTTRTGGSFASTQAAEVARLEASKLKLRARRVTALTRLGRLEELSALFDEEDESKEAVAARSLVEQREAADAALASGEFSRAQRSYAKLRDSHGLVDDAELRLNLARCHCELREYEDASREAQHGIATKRLRGARLGDAYIVRADALTALGDREKAAAHVASRDALMAADRERILALTEELKTQQRHLARAIRHTDSSSRGEEDGGFDRDRARTEAPDSYTDSVETPQRGRRDARSAWGFWKGSSPRAAASSRTAATPRPARAAGSPAIIRAASAPDIARHSDFVWEGSQGAQGTPPREDKPTDEEKVLIEQALLLKAEGNARHSAENFEGAHDCYIKAQSRVDKCSSTAAALVCKSCVLTLECVLLLHRVCSLTT